jgi:cation diffusion facilitator family transporter
MLSQKERAFQANRVTLAGSAINFILTSFKLFAGIYGRSTAMVADAIHSLSDFATDIVVIVSMGISRKPKDSSHDYGHGKFETLATFIIGGALLAVGFGIGYNGIKSIIAFFQGAEIEKPGLIALIAAVISIVSKEALYRWTVVVGRKINSQAVIANAWHHRSDAFSSIGTMVGIGGAIFLGEKWRILDPLAGVIVSLFILKVAIQITLGSLNELMESSLSEKEKNKIISLVTSVEGASQPHNLRTRKIGNNIAMDIHIRVNPQLNVSQAHEIATAVETVIRENFGSDSFVSVHVEPLKECPETPA